MDKSIYFKQRQEGYKKVLEEIKTNVHSRTKFENAIVEKIYRRLAKWAPDYEGRLKVAD